DVLEIGFEGLGEPSHLEQRLTSIKGARSAGTENALDRQSPFPQLLPMSTFAGYSAHVVTISRTINRAVSNIQNEWRDGADTMILKAGPRSFKPAGRYDRVIV